MTSAAASLAVVVLLSACSGGDPEGHFGPMAVVPGDVGDDMEAAVNGTFVISAECVLLDTGSEDELLLVFRDGQVSWDPAAGEIELEDSAGSVTLTDGAHVRLGGGGSSVAEDGMPSADYVSAREWSNPPAEECWRDARFDVHSAEGQGD